MRAKMLMLQNDGSCFAVGWGLIEQHGFAGKKKL